VEQLNIYVVNFFCSCIVYVIVVFQYEKDEEVVLWMNTVGPYHNRQETYSYFSLPFCMGPEKEISHYHETLSEALQGVELVFSGLDIDFQGNSYISDFTVLLTHAVFIS
jgi:transmembrane 9 superfamily member 3